MERTPWLAALGAALTTLALAPPAHAESTHYRFRGLQADAAFSSFSECGMADVTIHAGESVSREQGGPPGESALSYAWVSIHDWCTGSFVMGFGSIDAAEIASLDRASLRVPLQLDGMVCTGETCEQLAPGTVAVLEVELTGTGDLTHGTTMTHRSAGAFRMHARDTGARREATATGSLVLGARDLLAGATGAGAITSTQQSSHWLHRD